MANEQDQGRPDTAATNNSDRSHLPPNSGKENFEIHVKGHLNREWSDRLEGLEMKFLDNGEMILFGPIVDQAALMGVLNKLSNMNLALLSVNRVRKEE